MDPLALARKKRAEMAARGEKIVQKNPLEKLTEKPDSLRRAVTPGATSARARTQTQP